MRLINTSTGIFEEFIGSNIPQYAILSHTWEEEEVSFKTMTDNPSGHGMKGYQKIAMTCRMAAQRSIHYAWVDTCCIDKSSSAELTESINSMFRWYQRSDICYVYLSDLPALAPLEAALPHCRWFTRGWTLQELIAPQNVVFLDRDWNKKGDKTDLIDSLSRITGIDRLILGGSYPLSSVAVAQKMSWAAHRETTRTEDMAYCLLGIFDVNMPLMYGEEGKAFRRLQEEIIKSTADFSIFAWKAPEVTRRAGSSSDRVFCGVLAESPFHFAGCNSITRLPNQDWRDFSVSNSGIKLQAPILSEPVPGKRSFRYVLPVYCTWDPKVALGVRLRMCGSDQFVREDPWGLVEFARPLWANTPRVRYLLTELPRVVLDPPLESSDMSLFIARTRSHVLHIRRPVDMIMYDAWSWGRYDDEDEVFFSAEHSGRDAAAIRFNTILTGQGKTVEFESMFYALGWASMDINQLQCSMVDYQSHSTALNEVQSHIFSWDHSRYQVSGLLSHHRLPRASAATFAIPGTKSTAVVSFTPSLVSDTNICRNKFWRIEFSCQVYEADKLPTIRHEEWSVA